MGFVTVCSTDWLTGSIISLSASLWVIPHCTSWRISLLTKSWSCSRKCTQSACVSSSYVSSLYQRKLMSVGEKIKAIILRSQVGHNIYDIQTWITNTNTKGKNVFIHWVITLKALRMSTVTSLVCVYKSVIDSELLSAILSFTCALRDLLHLLYSRAVYWFHLEENNVPNALHQKWWPVRVCVAMCVHTV